MTLCYSAKQIDIALLTLLLLTEQVLPLRALGISTGSGQRRSQEKEGGCASLISPFLMLGTRGTARV